MLWQRGQRQRVQPGRHRRQHINGLLALRAGGATTGPTIRNRPGWCLVCHGAAHLRRAFGDGAARRDGPGRGRTAGTRTTPPRTLEPRTASQRLARRLNAACCTCSLSSTYSPSPTRPIAAQVDRLCCPFTGRGGSTCPDVNFSRTTVVHRALIRFHAKEGTPSGRLLDGISPFVTVQ